MADVPKRRRRRWTRSDIAIVRRRYPHEPTPRLARELKRSICSLYGLATKLGLHKSADYIARKRAVERKRLSRSGVAYRFGMGHVPANKGMRRPGWSPGRMGETQFKKGQRSCTWMPIGSYRITHDGYLQRKISDTGYPPRDWETVHRLLWISAHGPIPPGHKVVFKSGHATTVLAEITLDALELVSHAELMRRNSYHNNYPKEIAEVIRLRAQVVRQINRRTGAQHEKQN
jgi:hypothetical protein